MQTYFTPCPHNRQIFCNRTLNLRSIEAIGYDMDYTLVHYHVEQWEARAYAHAKERLLRRGWPIKRLTFDPELVTRGLVIDRLKGNLLKANRFGYIKKAMHGTQELPYWHQKELYSRELVELENPRFIFLNTLFSISEASLYLQLVDLFDQNLLPQDDVTNYSELAVIIRHALDMAHMEGVLKNEVINNPSRFVHDDPETALALYDQKMAGKKLLVITNSGWHYTKFMLEYAIERYLPKKMTWRELFDITVVSSRKPAFFLNHQPIFEVINDEGHLKPVLGKVEPKKIYLGGTASDIEQGLNLSGDEILYVGDHIYGDVNVSKRMSRWRTALILRELEREIEAIDHHREAQKEIAQLMKEKIAMEDEISAIKLQIQRREENYGPILHPEKTVDELQKEIEAIRTPLRIIDHQLADLVVDDGSAVSRRWGYLLRAGNDKSHLTRQIERHADIYTSRVSNFLHYTPFIYFRAPRGSMPHDPIDHDSFEQ